MTCHELIGGAPSDDAIVYFLDGDALFRTSFGERTRLSTAGGPHFLSRNTDDRGAVLTYAGHRRAGAVITREVWWQRNGGPRRLRFTERYDFARQRITTSGEPGDSCHHNGH